MSAKAVRNFNAIKVRVAAGEQAGLVALADEAKFRVIRDLYEPKSGRMYGGHQASAPGEPPASDSKHYEDSIKSQLTDAHHAACWVDPEEVPYANILEYGGEIHHGDTVIRIAPRSMWAQIREEMRGQDSEAIMAREMRKALS